MELRETPMSKAQMLVRRPLAEVFGAFINPAVTTRFWFSRGGRPEVGRRVRCDWEMDGVSTSVEVKPIEPNPRLLIEWDGYSSRSAVEWTFMPHGADKTFVSVGEGGFTGDGDEVVKQALNSNGSFNLLLAGLKVHLEHGVEPDFVLDHAPAERVEAAAP